MQKTKTKKVSNLSDAIQQSTRIRFHTAERPLYYVSQDKDLQIENADFFRWVDIVIGKDKGRMARVLYSPETLGLIEDIFERLNRSLFANDRFIEVDFASENSYEKFASFRKDILKDEDFFKDRYCKELRQNPNGLIGIDISEGGLPYTFLIDIREVVDITVKDYAVETISFNRNEKCYRFTSNAREIIESENGIVLESFEHNLGYCPVTFLYFDTPSSVLQGNPIASEIGKLDWLLFLELARKYLDAYSYPILEKPKESCDGQWQGMICNGGLVTNEDGRTFKCPSCNDISKSLLGAGSIYQKPFDIQDGKYIYMENALKFTAPDVANLEVISKRIDILSDSIDTRVTGFVGDSKQAENELQVRSRYENQQNSLIYFAGVVSKAQEFVLKTCAKEMFNDYLYTICDYGVSFYLKTQEDILNEIDTFDNANLPSFIKSSLLTDLIDVKFRNKEKDKVRAQMLLDLQLYPSLSKSEIDKLLAEGLTTKEEYMYQINFDKYIRSFELEYGDITNFQSERDYSKRIELIQVLILTKLNFEKNETENENDDIGQ